MPHCLSEYQEPAAPYMLLTNPMGQDATQPSGCPGALEAGPGCWIQDASRTCPVSGSKHSLARATRSGGSTKASCSSCSLFAALPLLLPSMARQLLREDRCQEMRCWICRIPTAGITHSPDSRWERGQGRCRLTGIRGARQHCPMQNTHQQH